jgi:hypothetical protein
MSGSSKPQTDTSSQGTLAGAGGLLVGSGITELQTNVVAGLILVGIGVAVLLIRAYMRKEWFNLTPEILKK